MATGAFVAPIRTEVSFSAVSAVVTDANGDSKLDLLMPASFSVGVALGAGDGTFVASTVNDNVIAAGELVAGDFDGDGHTDFVVPARVHLKEGFLRVYRGSGTGTFTAAGTTTA